MKKNIFWLFCAGAGLLALTHFSCDASLQEAETAEALPAEWFYYERSRDLDIYDLEGEQMPALAWDNMEGWYGDELDAEDLEGKIVVLDFWATWCGPCIAALPHNQEIQDTYPDDVVVLGICTSSDAAGMQERLNAAEVTYSNVFLNDSVDAHFAEWHLPFRPTYVVVDGEGVVRAAGLKPTGVDALVELLVEEAEQAEENEGDVTPELPPAPEARPLREEWLEGNAQARQVEAANLDGAPALNVNNDSWINSEALTLEDLQGKIVVLDFWATWCGPCLAAVPHNNDIVETYGENVVLIGICHVNGSETCAAVASDRGMTYPVVIDNENATIEAYGVNGFPDYAVIDAWGRLRAADVSNRSVEDVIDFLLEEMEATAETDAE